MVTGLSPELRPPTTTWELITRPFAQYDNNGIEYLKSFRLNPDSGVLPCPSRCWTLCRLNRLGDAKAAYQTGYVTQARIPQPALQPSYRRRVPPKATWQDAAPGKTRATGNAEAERVFSYPRNRTLKPSPGRLGNARELFAASSGLRPARQRGKETAAEDGKMNAALSRRAGSAMPLKPVGRRLPQHWPWPSTRDIRVASESRSGREQGIPTATQEMADELQKQRTRSIRRSGNGYFLPTIRAADRNQTGEILPKAIEILQVDGSLRVGK